jgi:hypothetical protein
LHCDDEEEAEEDEDADEVDEFEDMGVHGCPLVGLTCPLAMRW